MTTAPDEADSFDADDFEVLPPTAARPVVPLGGTGAAIATWFETVVVVAEPIMDGSLDAERAAAESFQRLAKAENTRRAYKAAVKAWCAWCTRHSLPPLPAAGIDVAAFLAGERHRGLTPNTIDLRRAGIRFLHRIAGCPVPTDDSCVAETVAGIRRDAGRKGELPAKKAAATANILREIVSAIPTDLRGLRDKALLVVGFAGALRRSELAAIRVEHLDKTERGLRLTLPQTKGDQAKAVVVPLPYGQTELCPVRALTRWLEAAGISAGPVFRRLWLPRKAKLGEPPPLPRIGAAAITPWTVAAIVQTRVTAVGFNAADWGGHSLKRGALTTGMNSHVHPARLKRLGRHKSFDTLGEYLEYGDLFEDHPLSSVL